MTGHRLVVENSFGDPAENIAGRNALSYLRRRMPIPFFVAGKARQIYAALKKVLGVSRNFRRLLRKFGKRILKSVVNLGEHAGSEFGGEKFARKLDLVAHHQIRRRIEHLHVADGAADTNYLGHESLLAENDVTDYVLGYGSVKCDGGHVSVYRYNLSGCGHCWTLFDF